MKLSSEFDKFSLHCSPVLARRTSRCQIWLVCDREFNLVTRNKLQRVVDTSITFPTGFTLSILPRTVHSVLASRSLTPIPQSTLVMYIVVCIVLNVGILLSSLVDSCAPNYFIIGALQFCCSHEELNEGFVKIRTYNEHLQLWSM